MANRGADRLDEVVEQYLLEAGCKTDREEVQAGVYRVAGLNPDTSQRRLVLVVPAASATVTESEVDWLVERAGEVDADITEVTTNGTTTPEARNLADNYGVTIQDPATYAQQASQPQHAGGQGRQSPPNQGAQQRPERGAPQRESQRQAGGGRQQRQSGGNQPPRQSGRDQPPRQGGRNQPRQGGRSQQPSQARPESDGDVVAILRDGFRPVGGFIYGALGYIVSFVLTTVYFFYRLDEITSGNIDQVLPDEPQALGWAFYNANMVEIAASAGGTTVQNVNYLKEIDQINPTVFYVMVAFALFLAGYSVAARVREPIAGPRGAVAGASIVVGYLPLLFVGTILFEAQESGVSAGPEVGGTLFLWGIIYTVVFGGIGGYLSRGLGS
jgi:hypothetical protein